MKSSEANADNSKNDDITNIILSKSQMFFSTTYHVLCLNT